MPAPRRPWPPSRPSRPPSLRESACERASRPRPPFPFSSRDPSRTGKRSNTWRARIGCGCGVKKRRRRGCVGCSMCGSCGSEHVDGVEYGGVWRWRLVRAAHGASGGGGYVRRRRRRVVARAAQRRGLLRGGEKWWLKRCAGGGEVERRRRRDGNESGGGGVKREEKHGPAARARDIYDRWARDFS